MYDVRLEFPQSGKEQQRGEKRKEAVKPSESCQIGVQQLGEDATCNEMIGLGVLPFCKSRRGHYDIAFGLCQLCNREHYFTGASVIDPVYLKHSQEDLLLKKSYFNAATISLLILQ